MSMMTLSERAACTSPSRIARVTCGVLLLGCAWISGCALLSGCAGSQPRAETQASISESAPEPVELEAAPECVNDQDQRVRCLADSDCCAGFVCGKDPELNQDLSYCIYAGGG